MRVPSGPACPTSVEETESMPLVPKPSDAFWAKRHEKAQLEKKHVHEIEGLRTNGTSTPDYIVRTEHGARWALRINPGEALDGVTWLGEPLPADPNAPHPDR